MTCGSWRASPRTDSSAPRAQPPLTPSYVFPSNPCARSVSLSLSLLYPLPSLSHSLSLSVSSLLTQHPPPSSPPDSYPLLMLVPLPRKTRRIEQQRRSTTTCCFPLTILPRILDDSVNLFIPSCIAGCRLVIFFSLVRPQPNANEDFCIFLLPHETRCLVSRRLLLVSIAAVTKKRERKRKRENVLLPHPSP